MSPEQKRYASAVLALSVIGLACAGLIVAGEVMGSPERRIFWNLAGAALGGILIVYGLILLLLRKMGMIGPRRAER